MYYNHNLNFLTIADLMEGKFDEAFKSAKRVESNLLPFAKDMPMVEGIAVSPLWVLVAFHKWDEILNYPVPDKSLHLSLVFSHFARGMAYTGQNNPDDAVKELSLMKQEIKEVPPDDVVGLNTASDIMNIALNTLEGKIDFSGDKTGDAIQKFARAVTIEDSLGYDEPPDWYPSSRLCLGGAYFSSGKFSDAEKVFRDDLKKYPHNGWALFGLEQCLLKENKNDEAVSVQKEFTEAWKNADSKLRMEDY
jgi:tetratricopeptide (TPR) repeat protein